MSMLEVKELTTKYITRFGEDVYAVDHVSLKVEEGKSLGIAGESGCGKSTLALSLMGYYFPPLHYTSGEIIIDGRNISGMDPDEVRKLILGAEIAYIPQSAMNALNPTRKIIHFIEDVIQEHDLYVTKKDIYERARILFETLGLPAEVLQKYPVELSGGMKQRTVIAVSVLLLPKVLIADEPSSALDVTSQKMVIKMLRQLMETGLISSMIFITHELPLLYNVTDDIMVMYAGQIVEKATAQEAVFDPLHPYSKGLMGSIIVPEKGLRDVKLTAIPGVPPNLKNPPAGCRFAERCKFVRAGMLRHLCPSARCRVADAPTAASSRKRNCGKLMPRRLTKMPIEKKLCLSTSGLTKVFGFGRQKTVAVDHVDLNLYEGEVVSIVGESGSGKTTLAKMLLGLIILHRRRDLLPGQEARYQYPPEETGILEEYSGDLSGSVLFLQHLQQDRYRAVGLYSHARRSQAAVCQKSGVDDRGLQLRQLEVRGIDQQVSLRAFRRTDAALDDRPHLPAEAQDPAGG